MYQKYFKKYPLFIKKSDNTTAIDVALDYNEIHSVDLMINFITKYQDSYVYADLFKNNLLELM